MYYHTSNACGWSADSRIRQWRRLNGFRTLALPSWITFREHFSFALTVKEYCNYIIWNEFWSQAGAWGSPLSKYLIKWSIWFVISPDSVLCASTSATTTGTDSECRSPLLFTKTVVEFLSEAAASYHHSSLKNFFSIRKTPHYLWELEGYLNSLGAIQTVPSKSPRTIQDLIGATWAVLVQLGPQCLQGCGGKLSWYCGWKAGL